MEYGISLGSNLGDRLANLQAVRRQILDLPGTVAAAQSPVYETEPVDVSPEHADKPYLNSVIIVQTELDPRTFIRHLHRIEAEMGRVRGADRNAPRPADADIIYAGYNVIRTPDLTVPHPRWAERRFVVQPLADVRPDLLLPPADKTVSQVLQSLPITPTAELFRHNW